MNRSIISRLSPKAVALVLVIAALTLVSFGMGIILGLGAGLITGGLGCFVLEWRISS